MSNELTTQTGQGGFSSPAVRATEGNAMEIASAAHGKMVEGQVLLAKKFPRDEGEAYDKIMTACKRPRFAETAAYQFSRGGTEIIGPSINLAKVLSTYWGNINYGWMELSRDMKTGMSHVLTYAWDLESNTKEERIFVVPHYRDTKGGRRPLTSDRDIYEHVANYAARRLRECIFAVVPNDVKEDAMSECNKTLQGRHSEPLADRIQKMVVAFEQFGVTSAQIADRYQKSIKALNERNMAELKRIFLSMRDGIGKKEDFFAEVKATEQTADKPSKAKSIKERMEKKKSTPPVAEQDTSPESEPPKKKRGRPRKAKPADETTTAAPEPQPEATQEKSPEPEAEQKEDDKPPFDKEVDEFDELDPNNLF